MNSDTFATTFRRNRACERCRKLRVKCSYADPTSTMCLRCLKSQQPNCIVLQPTGSRASAKKEPTLQAESQQTAAAAVAAANAAASQQQQQQQQQQQGVKVEEPVPEQVVRERRVVELEKLLKSTKKELDRLGAPVVQDNLERKNCVITAIESGSLAAQTVKQAYEDFQTQRSVFCPFEFGKEAVTEAKVDSLGNNTPLTALAMIIAAKSCNNPAAGDTQNIEQLTELFNKLLGMRVFSNKSEEMADILQSLGIASSYFGPFATMYPTMAKNLSIGAFLVSNWKLTVENEQDRERARLYLGVYSVLSDTANVTGKRVGELIGGLPMTTQLLDQIHQFGDEFDKMLVCRARMSLLGSETIAAIKSEALSPELIQDSIKKLASIREQAAPLLDTHSSPTDSLLWTFPMTEYTQKLYILEAALQQTCIRVLKSAEQAELVQSLGTQIADNCKLIIDTFLTCCKLDDQYIVNLVPKQVYMMPLQALAALCRLRVIYNVTKFHDPVEIEHECSRVKEILTGRAERSNLARHVEGLIPRIEMLMSMSQGLDTDNEPEIDKCGKELLDVLQTHDQSHVLLYELFIESM